MTAAAAAAAAIISIMLSFYCCDLILGHSFINRGTVIPSRSAALLLLLTWSNLKFILLTVHGLLATPVLHPLHLHPHLPPWKETSETVNGPHAFRSCVPYRGLLFPQWLTIHTNRQGPPQAPPPPYTHTRTHTQTFFQQDNGIYRIWSIFSSNAIFGLFPLYIVKFP